MNENDFDKMHEVFDQHDHKPCLYNALSRAVKHLVKEGGQKSYDLDNVLSTAVAMRNMEASICQTNSVDLSALNGGQFT